MQFGVHAALSRRRPRVQIPSGPLEIRMEAQREPTSEQGRVAQLAERAPEKREVTGSTPVPATYITADSFQRSLPRGARPRRGALERVVARSSTSVIARRMSRAACDDTAAARVLLSRV